MKHTTYTCDRCQQDMGPQRPATVGISNRSRTHELCDTCVKALERWLTP